MKVYLIGDMRAHFIKTDIGILQEDHQVRTFDLSQHATSFRQIPHYLTASILEILQVRAADLVWIWGADYWAIPFILFAKLFRKPVLVSVLGYEVYINEQIGYGNQRFCIRGAVSRWIIRSATTAITMSEAYRKIVRELLPGMEVIVIPGCIDETLCEQPLPDKSGVVTATCLNTNDELKGIHIFKGAARFIPDMKIIRNIPHEELMQEFRKAKVYCQLSLTESFGMSLLEAMACGCVPVVTDRDALPEVVGDTGFVVLYGDVYETAKVIRSALTADRTPARERARLFTKDTRKKLTNCLIGVCCDSR
jgi:glycosyltransferase involved in cell wall biosynthesis